MLGRTPDRSQGGQHLLPSCDVQHVAIARADGQVSVRNRPGEIVASFQRDQGVRVPIPQMDLRYDVFKSESPRTSEEQLRLSRGTTATLAHRLNGAFQQVLADLRPSEDLCILGRKPVGELLLKRSLRILAVLPVQRGHHGSCKPWCPA